MALGEDGLITVVGDYDALGGAPVSGKVTITPSVETKKGAITYPALPYVIPLNDEGQFSVALPATDDPAVSPNGFTYRFEVAVTATVNGRVYTDNSSTNFPLPMAAGNAQGVAQINDLVPAAAVGTPTVFLTKAVADDRYVQPDALTEALTSYVKTEDLEPVDLSGYATTESVANVATTAGNAASAAGAASTAAAAAAQKISNLLLVQAGTPDAMVTGTITRDANGAATAFDVVWPDGATGHFTGTASTSFPGAIDAYTITHVVDPGGSANTTTYTQAAVTRDANGAVTVRPAITVA